MTERTTRQQASRSSHARRMADPASQQRFLSGLGIQVSLDLLQTLPPGAWIRFVPEDVPLRASRARR